MVNKCMCGYVIINTELWDEEKILQSDNFCVFVFSKQFMKS